MFARIGRRVVFECKKLLGLRSVRLYRCPGPLVGIDTELVPVSVDALTHFQQKLPEFPWPDAGVTTARLQAGSCLWAVHGSEEPLCYGWLTKTSVLRLDELGGHATLSSPVTWVWDCVTPRSQRGQGYFTCFLKALRARAELQPLVIGAATDNTPSVKSIERAGFRPWATIRVGPLGSRVTMHDDTFGPLVFHRDRRPVSD